jgi:DNA-binding LacI/PurR family transcriptional regulator
MPARKRPTLQDVAAVAGVSVRTVSNVINEFPHVSTDTREKVQRAVTDLGYRINPTARNLRRGSTGMLGLVLPDLAQPYFAELAEVVLAQARRRGMSVLIERTEGSPQDEADVLLGDLPLLTDGLIVSPTRLAPGGARLDALDVPVVALTERLYDTGIDHVTIQDVAAARAATTHLLDRGRRRITALGADDSVPQSTAWLRERGYRAAHAEAGVPVDEALRVRVRSWTPEGGFRAVHELLDQGRQTDAVFAFNDSLAIGAIAALSERGLRVPEDVAVVGFDDIVESRFIAPSLTTISPGRAQCAELAVELLLARIDGERTGPGEAFYADFTLQVRRSSGG